MEGNPKEKKVFGDDILGMADRILEWGVCEHGLPSGRCSIRPFRAGWATCLYRSVVILVSMRNISGDSEGGGSIAIAIYLRAGDKIMRNFPSRLMRCDGLTSQLKVCNGNRHEIIRDTKG